MLYSFKFGASCSFVSSFMLKESEKRTWTCGSRLSWLGWIVWVWSIWNGQVCVGGLAWIVLPFPIFWMEDVYFSQRAKLNHWSALDLWNKSSRPAAGKWEQVFSVSPELLTRTFELMDVRSSMWVPHNLNLTMWNVITLKLSGPAQRDTCTTSEPNMQYISKDGVDLTVFIPPRPLLTPHICLHLFPDISQCHILWRHLVPESWRVKADWWERPSLSWNTYMLTRKLARGNHLHTWKNRFPEPKTRSVWYLSWKPQMYLNA